jgi:hypothetical protein
MKRFIAIYVDNYNDEFDIHGFQIMTDKEQSQYEEMANGISWDFEYCSNSGCISYSNGEDLLSRIEFKEITKSEFDNLEKLFDGQFGIFVSYDYLSSIVNGESNGEYQDDEFYEDEEEETDDY